MRITPRIFIRANGRIGFLLTESPFVLFLSVFLTGLACEYIRSKIGKLLPYIYPVIYNEFSCSYIY